MNCSRNGRSRTHVHIFGREVSLEEIVRKIEKEMRELIDGFFTLWIRYGSILDSCII
jgi:hypothetical protein